MKSRWNTDEWGRLILCKEYPNCNCKGHYEFKKVPKSKERSNQE